MKHKLVSICTLIVFVLASPLSAEDKVLDNKSKVDKLDWALTDVSMKKTATSMVMNGILITVSIVLLAVLINSSPGDSSTTTTTDSTSSSTS